VGVAPPPDLGGVLKLLADGDEWNGRDEVDPGWVDTNVDVVRWLEDADKSAVKHLGDAVATDGCVVRHIGESKAERFRTFRR